MTLYRISWLINRCVTIFFVFFFFVDVTMAFSDTNALMVERQFEINDAVLEEIPTKEIFANVGKSILVMWLVL